MLQYEPYEGMIPLTHEETLTLEDLKKWATPENLEVVRLRLKELSNLEENHADDSQG